MSEQRESAPNKNLTITRAAVTERIMARLDGRVDAGALAAWAFDRFYAEELGEETYEPGAEPAIADALDALMFSDDPGFQLDEEELRALIAQLG